MKDYFTITVRDSLESTKEVAVYQDKRFKKAMREFFKLDLEVKPDSILTFYWKDGKKFRQWFAGRNENLSAC